MEPSHGARSPAARGRARDVRRLLPERRVSPGCIRRGRTVRDDSLSTGGRCGASCARGTGVSWRTAAASGVRLIARAVGFTSDPLGLQRGEEALHCGVISDVARPAHRTGHVVVGHQPLGLLARILAARSEWCSRASGIPRRQISIISASVTSRAVMLSLIDQPTTRREKRSMTTAPYSHPSAARDAGGEPSGREHASAARYGASHMRDLRPEDRARRGVHRTSDSWR